MLDFYVSSIPGIRRFPRNSAINTITAIAGVIALTLAASEANQRLLEVKDYAGNVVMYATSSGSLTMSGTLSLRSLNCTGNANGGALTTNALGQVSCSDDDSGGGGSAGTGSLQAFFDGRYVNESGDGMTGGLLIKNGNPKITAPDTGLMLEIVGSSSGRSIFAQDALSTSGSLNVELNANVHGTVSGSALNVAGGGITMSNANAVVFNENSLDADFRIETDSNTHFFSIESGASDEMFFGGSALNQTIFYLNDGTKSAVFNDEGDANFTMRIEGDTDTQLFRVQGTTDRVGIGIALPDTKLEVSGTVSGSVLYATDSLRSSGGLVWEGTASGAMIRGLGLVDCDTDATSKLLWDTTTGKFSCGADQNTGSASAGQGITIVGSVVSLTAAHSGTTIEAVTLMSGAIVHGQNELRSSGSLAIEGDFWLQGGDVSGPNLTSIDIGEATAGAVTFAADIIFDGNAFIGLGSAAGKLEFDNQTTDELNIINANVGIGTSTPTEKLEVVGLASGTTIYASSQLRSSGGLVWEGTASGAMIRGLGLVDCDADGDTLAWDTTTGKFSCGDDDSGAGSTSPAQGLTSPATGFLALSTSFSGTALEIIGTASGRQIHAQDGLHSSGSLTVRGRMTGSGGTLSLARIGSGSTTYSSVQDLMNFVTSPGVTTGGILTMSGTQAWVGAGDGFIKATDSNIAQLNFMQWSGTSSNIPTNMTRYIGVDYNAGNPSIIQKTTDTFDLDTQFPLGVVVNDAGTLYKMNNGWIVGDTIANIIERFDSDALIERDAREGGLILSNSGTRNIAITAGQLLARLSEFAISALDTSVSGSFDTYYRDGAGGWTKATGVTQWDNTNYDDGDGGLATVSAIQYASKWFYLMSDGTVAMMYGRSVSTAVGTILEDDTPPSTVPDRIGKLGILIGRIVFQGSSNTPVEIQSAFDSEFNATAVSDHGELAGLTDDDHTQYLLLAGRSGGQTAKGGTAATDALILQSTAGVGTTDHIKFLVGNNGATESMRILNSGNVAIGAITADTKLEVVGTMSGQTIYARDSLRSSGTLVWEGAGSGASLTVSNGFDGSGLSDCDTAATSKLLWDATTKRFSCGSDTDTGGTAGQGITVAGSVISLTAAHSGTTIEAVTLLSGATVHAQNALRSSGTTVLDGNTWINGTATVTDVTCTDCLDFGDFEDILNLDATTKIVLGTVNLQVDLDSTGDFDVMENNVQQHTFHDDGSVAFNRTNAAAGDIVFDSIDSEAFFRIDSSLSSILIGSSNATKAAAEVVIGTGAELISAKGVMSGYTLYATSQLRSSGGLVWEGAGSGASLTVSNGFKGSGLDTDCDTAGTSKLLWDVTTSRFSCGTDSTAGTAGQGITLAGGVISLSTSFSGTALEILGTMSGKLVHAGDNLTSSGGLMVKQTGHFLADIIVSGGDITGANGALLDLGEAVSGDISVTGDFIILDNSFFGLSSSAGRFEFDDQTTDEFNILSANVGIGTATPTETLEVVGTISGSTIYATNSLRSSGSIVWEGAASGASLTVSNGFKGSGLSDCDTEATSKLMWDVTTSRFSCGADQNSGGSVAAAQGLTLVSAGVLRLSDSFSGTALEIMGTASGRIIHAQDELRSSGTLLVEGAANFSGSVAIESTLTAGDISCTDCLDFDSLEDTLDLDAGTEINFGGSNLIFDLDGLGDFRINDASTQVLTIYDSGLVVFNEDGSATYDFRIEGDTDTDLIKTVASTNRVGIGKSSPVTKLEVVGTISGSTLHVSAGTQAAPAIAFNFDTDTGIYSTGANVLGIVTAGKERMRFSSDGKIYLNHPNPTENTNAEVIFNGDDGAPESFVVRPYGDVLVFRDDDGNIGHKISGTGTTVFNTRRATSLDVAINAQTAGTTAFFADVSTGRIGMQTDTPQATLDVNGSAIIRDTTYILDNLTVGDAVTTEDSSYATLRLTGAASDIGAKQLWADSSDIKWTWTFNEDTAGTNSGHLALTNVDGNTFMMFDEDNDRVGILTATPDSTLEVIGTMSGKIIHAGDNLTSSGSLEVRTTAKIKGTLTGNTLTGFNLTDCDGDGQTLAWDSTNQRFECGDDDTSVSVAGQGLTLTSGILSLSNSFSGTALEILGTMSGKLVHAGDNLTSSGGLQVKGTAEIHGTLSGNLVNVSDLTCTDCLDFAEFEDTLDQDAATTINLGNNDMTYTLDGTGDLYVKDGSTIMMRWEDDGNVCFGANANFCEYAFHINISDVASGVDARTDLLIEQNDLSVLTMRGSTTNSGAIFFGDGGGRLVYEEANDALQLVTNFKTVIYMDSAQEVGIGTKTPETKLEVVGTTSGNIIHAQDELTSSGKLVVEGYMRVPRYISFPLCNSETACAVGSGASVRIGPDMNNYILSGAWLSTAYTGTTGTMTVQLREITDAQDMFSTAYTLDSAERDSDTAATPGVVSANTLEKGDILVPRVSAVHTTPAKGASLLIYVIPK